MTVIELLAQLNEKNVMLSVDGDNLVVRGNEQVLETPAVLELLRKNKKALVEHIKAGRYVDPKGIVQAPPNRIPPGCEAITPEMLPLAQLTQPEIDSIVDRTPGGAPNVQDIYPLGPLQEGMLFHHLLATEGDVYLSYSLFASDTRAMLDRVLEALQAMIDRHDILRTAVLWEELSEPIQAVWRRAPLAVEEVHIDPTAGDVAEELFARFDPRRHRLDVRHAPLMRVYIAHDSRKDRWLMLHLFHHLSIDHVAFEVLLEEIQAYLLGGAEQLPAPPPFRNFVAQARLGTPREEHERFFREMLGDVDEPTAPYGLIDVYGDGSGVREAWLEVDAMLASRLRQTSRALEVSAASLYHLACALVLGRVSGRDDVVFGTILFGRMGGVEGAHRALGMLLNTLPIRIQLDASSVEESARRTHQSLAELMKHEHASLALAQRCSGVEAPTPLYSAHLNYRYGVAAETVAGAAENTFRVSGGFELLKIGEGTNYPLTLSVDDIGAAFVLGAKAQSPADPDRICAYMRTALEQLVEALEQSPATPIRSLEVLPASERHQLLEEWNATEIEYSQETRIQELFESQVRKTPEAIALVYEEQSLTYNDLNVRANRLAWRLRGLGAGPDARVAICLERSLEMVVALLATLKAGAAYVPLDPDCPPDRLAYMLGESRPLAVLTEDRVKAEIRVALSGSGMPVINLAPNAADDESRANEAEANLNLANIGVTSEHLAYVIYTSGSTGAPKGVMARHGSVTNLITALHQAIYRNYETPLRVSINAPLFFDASVKQLVQLSCGHSLYIVPEELRVDAGAFLSFIARREIEVLDCTPSQLRLLLEAGLGKQRALKLSLVGGEAINGALWGELAESAGTTYFNVYGPTECTVDTSICQALPELSRPTVGRPIANVETYIVDAHMRPVPVEVSGELYIGGDGLARGYLNRADLTAERFLPNPHGSRIGARLYRTGDQARYLPDGRIDLTGRLDNQVKIRGYRIELGEIESVLRSDPSVRECVVVARENADGDKRLVAYWVSEEGSEPSSSQLRRHIEERLPGYMAPAVYVRLEKLPLTPNGKVDRRALLAPDVLSAEESDGYLPPQTPVEEIVVGIFEEVLKLDRVGRKDNFFELGGHSLLATQVISRVMKMSGVEIGVRSIFEKPTAEGLSRSIEEAMKAGEKAPAPPLVRIDRESQRGAGWPLSFAQRRLWFIDRLNPGSFAYNIPRAVRLNGALKLDALERVINEIIRRHEILRTRFGMEAGEPTQIIDRWEPRRLEVVDLTSLPPEERELEIGRRTREEAEMEFDLSLGPLLRVKVLKLAEDNHVALYAMSHIVSDAWSTGILIREVGTLYQAYSVGESSPLDELPIQYADFAVWQREWLKGEALEEKLEYWRKQLVGMEDLDLPTDRPRPATRSYRGGSRHFVVERAVAEKLRDLGRREGVTLFMTLLGGFDVLMSRYSGQEDVTIGTDIANRNRTEIEGLIGFFVNQLALRVEVRAEEGFSLLLKRVKETCLGAYAHQDLPFEKLVEVLRPERELSKAPLFQVKLILQNAPSERLRQEEVELRSGSSGAAEVASEAQTAALDLTVAISDEGHELVGGVVYSRDLFEAGTIDRLMSHYGNVLKGVVEDSKRPISDLSLLSETEREQIVVEWNQTGSSYSKDRRIHELFEEQAERNPERIALISEGKALSYGELNRRANQLGNYLRRLGVGPEVVVGLCLSRSVEMVVGLLGALKAGGAYLPLDADSPLERTGYMLEDAGVGVVLTERKLEERLPAFWGQTVCLDEEWEWIREESEVTPVRWPENGPGSEVEAENLAYVIYTSGSTGKPKGVMVRHRSLVNYSQDICRRLGLVEGGEDQGLKFATVSTITADLGNTCIYPSLLSGGCLHVLSYETAIDGIRFEEYLRQELVDVLKIVPSHLSALLRSRPNGVRMLPQKYLILGGEALSYELVNRVRERGEGCEVINHYGPTETTIGSLMARAREADIEVGRSMSAPIGQPIANTRSYVLDRDLNPAPVGARGELQISGEGVARGYLGRPDQTAERFIPDPFSREVGERLYRTGDVVRYLSDGKIEFLGRADNQVKINGFRIELGEIEARLMDHPEVREAVVVVRKDVEGDKRLVAYYSGREAPVEALRAHLTSALPDYMAPSAYIHLESLPLTPNGKLDRRALPAPDARSEEERDRRLVPRTPVEEIVIGIFEEVLKLERVGRKDNFFELGGHSLLAVQVISRLRNSFGVEIGVRSVFEKPTAEGLSRKIEEAMRAGVKAPAPPLVRVDRESRSGARFPLSFAQQRLWFIDRLNPGSVVYNNSGVARLGGDLNLDALERTINEIVRRHEVLRTRFEVDAGEPAQVIDQWEPRKLEVIDLTSLNPEERKAETDRRVIEEAETGFDLSRGPLFRVKVLKLAEDEHVALYTMHHVVSDAWSMEILIGEIGTLYRAYSMGAVGEAPPLPELPIQYADFAVWQRAWLQGEALEEKLKYWRRQLAGIEDLDLPTDRPRPATRSYRGGARYFAVDGELTRKLRELSQRDGVTLFMAMLGGFYVLMSRYSGQRDVVIGTDTANRNRVEIEGLIGFFVNQLALRVEVRTGESFKELLKQVREACLEAYAHEDAPFEKLVEELRPERDLSRSPLFQAKLIWQNAQRAMPGLGAMSLAANDGDEVWMENEAQTARFDLLVSVVDAGRNLVGVIEYSRDMFEGETVGRLIGHYTNALREIADDSERPISTLNLLSGAEREQIVVEWNRTERPYINDRPFHELFAEQVERTPERIALIGGGKLVSYRELNRRADQLGGYLQRLGVGPEVVVGVCLERSVEMIVAVLGTLKAGGAYLPLDPEFPAERLALLLEDAGVRVVLTQQRLEERLQTFRRQTVLIDAEWERISGESERSWERWPDGEVEAENLAYVIYTSGSTGKPKGVMVRHRSLVNYSQDICRRLGLTEGAEDHNLQFATVSTIAADLGNTCIYPSLLGGGCLHVLSYETAIDGMRFGEYLRHEPIDVLKIVPSHLNGLLTSQPNEVKMLPQKYLILGGEALSYELVDRIRARGEGCEVINHYGPTETTIGSLMAKAPEVDVEEGRAMSAPIGSPIANTRSYVLDRDFNPLPVLARGELQISGEGVARGYLGRPDMTAERFIPNPFSQIGGERLYRTGDVVKYLSDGKTEFLGRADDQVKVRGYRIELGEIQAVLNEHRGVRQSVIVAREDERGDKRIVGYVVAEEEVTVAELKEHVRERLPEYMTPETILLLEEIPLTANGKLDRKRLGALFDALQPKEESFIRSRDIFEHRLLKIWEDLLDIRPIGVKDNFFDLGGHSILAAILMAQIKSEFGRELPLYVLFQEGTIERLAIFLKQEASSMTWSSLVEFQSSGSKPPLFFVHPGGGNVHNYYELARCLGSDRPFYAFQQPGLYRERALFTSIEDLAAYYIETMKTAQPEGPYFIGGWSFGGLVAFEMARQLFAQDQKVGQIMLLDSGAPISMKEYLGEEHEEPEEDEDEHKDDATLLLELMGGLGLSAEDLKPYEGDKRIEYVIKTGIGMDFFPPDVDITRARTYLELFRTNGRARRKYLPQAYQGSVTLFRPFRQLTLPPSDGTDSSERIARSIHDNGWSELAAGGVRVIEVPGDHRTMVGNPHVETLALRIRECLDEAETIDS